MVAFARFSLLRRGLVFPVAALTVVGVAACEEVIALQEEPAPPGWVMSRPFPEIETLHGVAVLSPTLAYAVGTDGAIIKYDTGTWSRQDSGTTVDLLSISAASDNEGNATVLAVGEAGTVLRLAGEAWTPVVADTTELLFDVWVRAANDAFIVGDNGAILRFNGVEAIPMTAESLQERTYTDAQTGQQVTETFPIREPLKGVVAPQADNAFAVGPTGIVYHFDGSRWRTDETYSDRNLSDGFAGGFGVWVVGANGGVFRREGENDWRDFRLQDPNYGGPAEDAPTIPVFLQGLWGTSPNDLFAVGLAKSIYHRTEGRWFEIPLEEDFHLRGVAGTVVAEATETTPMVREVFGVGGGGRIVRGPTAISDERVAAGETVDPADLVDADAGTAQP